jgi:hypothetical protein
MFSAKMHDIYRYWLEKQTPAEPFVFVMYDTKNGDHARCEFSPLKILILLTFSLVNHNLSGEKSVLMSRSTMLENQVTLPRAVALKPGLL